MKHRLCFSGKKTFQRSTEKDKNQHALFLGLFGNVSNIEKRENHEALDVCLANVCTQQALGNNICLNPLTQIKMVPPNNNISLHKYDLMQQPPEEKKY